MHVPSDLETPTEWNPVGASLSFHQALFPQPLCLFSQIPTRGLEQLLSSVLVQTLQGYLAAGGSAGCRPPQPRAPVPPHLLQKPARACSERAGPDGGGGRRERPWRWGPGGAAQSSELRTHWRPERSPQVAGSGAPPRPASSPCAHRLRPAPGRSTRRRGPQM